MSTRTISAALGVALLAAATLGAPVTGQGPTVEVVAQGLHAPRGLVIAADGSLLVAEAGQAGDPADRQFMPPDLATMGWLMRGSADGTVESVADVAGFETSDDPDAEFSGGVPDANPYSVAVSADGSVVVADAAMNALVAVDDAGTVSLVAFFPPREHLFPAELLAADEDALVPVQSVPTSVVVGPDGAYYVGELTGGPFPIGGANVWRVVPGQEPTDYATGFTNIIDLGFGPDGTLYVAEIAHEGLMDLYAGQSEVAPAGAVLSVPPGGGEPELLASGDLVTALGGLAVAADGSIFVSANTLDREDGTVLKITP